MSKNVDKQSGVLKILEKTVVPSKRPNVARKWGRALLVGIPMAFVVVGLCAERRPSWYRPVRLDEQGIEEARLDAMAWIDEVSAKMVHGRPFEVALRDRDLNRWLAVWVHDRGAGSVAANRRLADPSLAFVNGAVRFGALGESSGWRAILGMDVEIRVEESSIRIETTRASIGALPFPVDWFAGWLKVFAPSGEPFDGKELFAGLVQYDSTTLTVNPESGFMGSIRNEFVWPNGERPFRIEAIAIQSGEARIKVQPL